MKAAFAIIGVLASAVPLAADAGRLFRCTSAGGAVTFQEQPCGAAADERIQDMPEYPPANLAERDRLLQREAALDARLLKRAEIDSNERIAREARRSLELEAERARAAEPIYVGPVYGVGYLPAHRPRPQQHLRNGPLLIRGY
jgi:hypothetical protein